MPSQDHLQSLIASKHRLPDEGMKSEIISHHLPIYIRFVLLHKVPSIFGQLHEPKQMGLAVRYIMKIMDR